MSESSPLLSPPSQRSGGGAGFPGGCGGGIDGGTAFEELALAYRSSRLVDEVDYQSSENAWPEFDDIEDYFAATWSGARDAARAPSHRTVSPVAAGTAPATEDAERKPSPLSASAHTMSTAARIR